MSLKKKSVKKQLASWTCQGGICGNTLCTYSELIDSPGRLSWIDKCDVNCKKGLNEPGPITETLSNDPGVFDKANMKCTYTPIPLSIGDTVINPTDPGGKSCANPFTLTSDCTCFPTNSNYDATNCLKLQESACANEPHGPGCDPDCSNPNNISLNPACFCHPCHTKFAAVRPICAAIAKNADAAITTTCPSSSDPKTETSSPKTDPQYPTYLIPDLKNNFSCKTDKGNPGCFPLCHKWDQLDSGCLCADVSDKDLSVKQACQDAQSLTNECDKDPNFSELCLCNPVNPNYEKACPSVKTTPPPDNTSVISQYSSQQIFAAIVGIVAVIALVGTLLYFVFKKKPLPNTQFVRYR
jgi:hypothetical protein